MFHTFVPTFREREDPTSLRRAFASFGPRFLYLSFKTSFFILWIALFAFGIYSLFFLDDQDQKKKNKIPRSEWRIVEEL